MRRAARVDDNQVEIVNLIRSMGGSVQHMHTIPGALDLIIGYRGIDQRVEIKNPDQPPSKRRLTGLESQTMRDWRGRKPVAVESVDDVIEVLSDMFKEYLRLKQKKEV